MGGERLDRRDLRPGVACSQPLQGRTRRLGPSVAARDRGEPLGRGGSPRPHRDAGTEAARPAARPGHRRRLRRGRGPALAAGGARPRARVVGRSRAAGPGAPSGRRAALRLRGRPGLRRSKEHDLRRPAPGEPGAARAPLGSGTEARYLRPAVRKRHADRDHRQAGQGAPERNRRHRGEVQQAGRQRCHESRADPQVEPPKNSGSSDGSGPSPDPGSPAFRNQILALLNSGGARVDGHKTIDGRETIEISSADGHTTYYVDPDSYDPVELDTRGTGGGVALRFRTYESLPSEGNTGLLDLRAQHPDAAVDRSAADYDAAQTRLFPHG
jgi:hypothetical protein